MASTQESEQARDRLRELVERRLACVRHVEEEKAALETAIEDYWKVADTMLPLARLAEINRANADAVDGSLRDKFRIFQRRPGKFLKSEQSRMKQLLKMLED